MLLISVFGQTFSPACSAALSALNNETSRILPKKLIGAGMGLMQLIQLFGGSLSVAVCGLLLAYQKKDLPSAGYQHIYAKCQNNFHILFVKLVPQVKFYRP